MIDGMQTRDSAGHPKMLAYLKHYTVYSREQNRMHSEANVTDFDLHDSYLAQYEEAFKANASGVMCSQSLHLTFLFTIAAMLVSDTLDARTQVMMPLMGYQRVQTTTR